MYKNIRVHTRSQFLLFLIPILLIGCRNSRLAKLSKQEGVYLGTVEVSAGDDIDYIHNDTLNFMAYPMNVAIFEGNRGSQNEIFLVGKTIRKGQEVAFKPVALLTYDDYNSIEQNIVIARPLEEDFITTRMNSYFELISVNYGVQKMIETWVKNSKGFGSVKNLHWDDEHAAMEYLERYNADI